MAATSPSEAGTVQVKKVHSNKKCCFFQKLESKLQRNWFFITNLNFLIPISLQPLIYTLLWNLYKVLQNGRAGIMEEEKQTVE